MTTMSNDYDEEEVKLMLDDCTNERRKHQLTKWDRQLFKHMLPHG